MRGERRPNLNTRLELWARWILNGCNERSGFSSMLEMLMATKGQFNGAGGLPDDDLETSVEAAVGSLTALDESAAMILRVEYGVWAVRSLDSKATQIDKAHALSIPLRTYRRKLAKAREYVAKHLGLNINYL